MGAIIRREEQREKCYGVDRRKEGGRGRQTVRMVVLCEVEWIGGNMDG